MDTSFKQWFRRRFHRDSLTGTRTYGQGLYGKNLFGAGKVNLTVTLTDSVTGETGTGSSFFAMIVTVTDPGEQLSTVGTTI